VKVVWNTILHLRDKRREEKARYPKKSKSTEIKDHEQAVVGKGIHN
jgi:hypothetical protein